MASGSIKGAFSGTANAYPLIEWSSTLNKAGNYSDVRATLYFVRVTAGQKSYNLSGFACYFNINGGTIQNKPFDIRTNAKYPVWTRTVRVNHDGAGNKSITIGASGSTGVSLGSFNFSKGVALDKNPRAYNFQISSSKPTGGDPFTILVNDNGSGFTAKAELVYGSATIKFNNGNNLAVKTNYNIILDPAILMIQNPSATTGWGRIIVTTYSGSTKIGSSEQRIDITWPAKYVPTVTAATFKDISTVPTKLGVGGSDGLYLKGLSNLEFAVTGAGIYGSTIKQYSVSCEGMTSNSKDNTVEFNLILYNITAGAKEFKVKVTDTRGRTAEMTVKATIIDYNPPKITSYVAVRNQKTVTQVDIAKAGSVTSLTKETTELNTYTAVTSYKLVAAENWTVLKTETNAFGNLTLPNTDIGKGYNLQTVLTDKLGNTATTTATVGTAKYPISVTPDGGVGINKIWEQGALDVDGDIWMNGRSLLDTFYPIGSIYQSVKSTNPATFMGGTWERFSNGKVLVGVDESDTDFDTAEKTGGTKTKNINTSNLPARSMYNTTLAADKLISYNKWEAATVKKGTFFTSTLADLGMQSGQAFSVMQPYTTVYMWKRTA